MGEIDNHVLKVLPKLTEGEGTVSGKCSAGDAMHGAAATERELQDRHHAHLVELGLVVDTFAWSGSDEPVEHSREDMQE